MDIGQTFYNVHSSKL